MRRDGVCDCDGTPESPCSAIPLVRDHLAAGGARPLGRHPDTWPRTWLQIPSHCPICDCPTIPDRHLDSQAGPGWRCSLTNCRHFWMIRMEPLRRFLATNPPEPHHPWYDTPQEECQAWLENHCHPPRIVPSEKGNTHALDRKTDSQGQPGAWLASSWLETPWIQRGPIRHDDGLLRSRQLGRDR